MNRRNFTQLGATVIGMSPFMGFANSKKALPQKPAWLLDLIRLNDKQISDNPNPQIIDPQSPDLGAICDGDGIPNALSTGGYISLWAISVSCPESIHYASANLIRCIEKGALYLTKNQHSDGTIDLLSSNFHSPPDTAFSVDNVAVAYQLISGVKGAEKALIPLKKYLLKAGEALIVGGIHTPNHRWVVAAALLKLHAIWPDKRYVARAEEWLLEHIDIDPDGQYTEKSAGGYTAIVNRMLIEMAKGLKKPEILDAVRKNLNMTMYYVHPNGEVVTEASNRQDKGTIKFLNSYYYSYRTLALLDQNGEFAAMCKLIDKSSGNRNSEHLNHFLLEPELWKELPAVKSLPTNYVKTFPYSGIVRIRRGQWDTTILSNNPGFLTFHKGNAVLQGMRIAASFFGKGQFQSSEIKQDGNKWILKNALEGPYYQPYPKDKIEWVIIDDGTDKIKDLIENSGISQIKYYELDTKLTLGSKRNLMHEKTTGDIIVYMDDDDYYPPERIQHAVDKLLENSDILIAGASEMYIYFKHISKMYKCGPYAPYHATAGTFAFKKELLKITKYNDTKSLGEEKEFLKDYTIPMVQL
ncbi:MAG: glycosyltransferase family 2 protein, partial [Cytophagia bacterium]|nr:glycosyltransferase family 2 protein [Cytophagia bacterium]